METVAIHHVAINVRNLDEALKFYCEVLGGSVRTDRPNFGFGGAWIDFGGQQLHLLEAEPPPNAGQHFAVLVPNIVAAVAELRERGFEVSDPSPVNANWQAFVEDPSGNVVEIHEVGGYS